MARTKQTARKSTGGKAPRRIAGYGSNKRRNTKEEEEVEEEDEGFEIDTSKIVEITKMNRKELIKALTEEKQSTEGLRKALELRLIRHLEDSGQLKKPKGKAVDEESKAESEEHKKPKAKGKPKNEEEESVDTDDDMEEDEPPRKKRK